MSAVVLKPIFGTAGDASASLSVEGLGTVTFDITGTWVGTISFYVDGPGGTRNALDVSKADTPGTMVNSTTSNGVWSGNCAGYSQATAVFTAYTSGTAYVSMMAAEAGGGGGGAGGAGTSDTTEATQLSVLAGIGATTDAAATQGSTGSVSAKLRTVTSQLNTSAANQTLQINLASPAARSDTYTTTATGTAVDGSLRNFKFFGIRVTGTGAAPTSWTVVLEVSVDGTTYNTLLTHTNTTDSNGAAQWSASPAPGLKFRSRCTALSLGSATNIVADIIGAP